MSVIVLLIVAGGVVAAGFLAAFVWAVRSGQFDDTNTPAVRMLFDDSRPSVSSTRPDRRVVRSRAGRPSAGGEPPSRRRRFGELRRSARGGEAPAPSMEDVPHVTVRR